MGSSPNVIFSLLGFSLLRERIVQLTENAKIGEPMGTENLTFFTDVNAKAALSFQLF